MSPKTIRKMETLARRFGPAALVLWVGIMTIPIVLGTTMVLGVSANQTRPYRAWSEEDTMATQAPVEASEEVATPQGPPPPDPGYSLAQSMVYEVHQLRATLQGILSVAWIWTALWVLMGIVVVTRMVRAKGS